MKEPKQFTLVGLVLRLLALKMQEQLIKARRKCLRAELNSRLPENVPQIIAGWRIRRAWRNGYHHTSSFWTEGTWIVAIKRSEPKTKETTL